jgi:hypothetical protein
VKQKSLLFPSLAAAGGRAARALGKNCVKVLIGRKIYPNDDALFFRQYFLHLTGLRPIRKITCTGLRGEGATSQALTIMNTINFARSSGLTYVHTPFTLIQHAQRPMEKWVAVWEKFFNLGQGEIARDPAKKDAVDSCYNLNDLLLCFGWRDRRDELSRNFKALLPEFKRRYYLNKSPRTTEDVTVAVHIRRGDVSAVRNFQTFTSNETILRAINAVKAILGAREVKYRIRVYSQGSRADFAELSLPGVEFFLDADALWTLEEMIEADVLIMAKGCFSRYAGLISDGIKLYEPWEESAPLEDWIACPADGSLDRAAFERQLHAVLQNKATKTG